MSDFLKISRKPQILEIVLDRPKANALDAPSSREMGKLFAGFEIDGEIPGTLPAPRQCFPVADQHIQASGQRQGDADNG